MKKIKYPAIEEIIEYNILVLNMIKVKKADKPEVLSREKISKIIEGCEKFKGDIYDKAVFLMEKLVKEHPFASGNRRTAFIVVKNFLLDNNSKFGVKDNPGQARIMLGIREGYYEFQEIKEWIKNGKIRNFER